MEIAKLEEKGLSKRIKDSAIVTPDFKVVFQTIAYDIGIREALDLNDLDAIFNYVQKFFGLMSLENMRDAFDMYSAQELDFRDSHFNQFDKVFVGKVLKSYNEKKKKEAVKPKLHQPIPRVESGWNEKKSHFEWLLNDVFLDDTEHKKGKKRNGKRGEFPQTIICNWKDVYDHMVSESMIKEKQGFELAKRLEDVKNQVILEDKSKTKSLSGSVKIKIEAGSKPMAYYKYEVIDWFKENKGQLTF